MKFPSKLVITDNLKRRIKES